MPLSDSVHLLLDQQTHLAIWYAEYTDCEEVVCYANNRFSEIFGLSTAQILERKKYHLINPPETSAETIEQYRQEDFEAMQAGYYFNSCPMDAGKQLIVIKLSFAQGILGLFKIIDTKSENVSPVVMKDLDPDFRNLLQELRPELLETIRSSDL